MMIRTAFADSEPPDDGSSPGAAVVMPAAEVATALDDKVIEEVSVDVEEKVEVPAADTAAVKALHLLHFPPS